MQNQSRTLWVGLIVAIVLGLSIEFLKSAKDSVNASWRPRLFGMSESDEVTSNRDQAQRARSRLLRGRLAGLADNKAALSASPTGLVAAAPAGLPNMGAPVSINADALKKKIEATAKKKKKKKKAKPAETKPGLIPATSPSDDASPDNSSSDVSGASGTYGGGSSQTRTLVGTNIDNENPETLDEWLQYILREPNYERTMKLVEAQQQLTIDSEIFHEVVSQMLGDSRSKMHEFAVLALGSAPSVKSFLLLETANVREIDASELKIQSRTYLKAYSKIENLRYLASVIATPLEAPTAYEALRLIQLSVATYKPRSTSPSTGSAVATQAVISRQFTSLVPVLTRVAATAVDPTVQQEAAKTLREVNSLIGAEPSAPAVVASGR